MVTFSGRRDTNPGASTAPTRPASEKVVTIEEADGLPLVQRAILKGFDERFVEGQTVYATIVVDEANIASLLHIITATGAVKNSSRKGRAS